MIQRGRGRSGVPSRRRRPAQGRAAPSGPPFHPHVVLSRLELLEPLGQGAFGRVYRAFDRVLHRQVAVKEFFLRDTSRGSGSARRELEILSRLRHPSLAQVHDVLYDPESGTRYLTEDLVIGHRLDEVLARADWDERLRLFVLLLQGLEYLHQQGIVHLDIKPANILVPDKAPDSPPIPKILDFGIACDAATSRRQRLLAGTFPFIAPELAQVGSIDGRADLYSLALTFYQAARGLERRGKRSRRPVPLDVAQIVNELKNRSAPSPGEFPPDTPAHFRDVIVTLLQPNPRDRFWSANDVIRRLNALSGRSFPIEPGRLRFPDKTTAVLAGRQEELQRLVSAFETFRGHPRSLFIGLLTGPPLSGKSPLLDEFRRHAETHDFDPIALTEPGQDLHTLFERLLDSSDAAAVDHHGPFLKELLPARFASSPDAPLLDTDPGLRKAQLLEKWAEALLHLWGERDRVLLVDDLDRRDGLRAFLASLAQRLREESSAPQGPSNPRLFVLATVSSRECGAALSPDLRLDLTAWGHDRARSVIRRLLGIPAVPERFVRILLDRTEGVAGLAVEYLRLAATNLLRPGEDIEGQLDAIEMSRDRGVAGLASWHAEELQQLPELERAALRWMSVTAVELTEHDILTLHAEDGADLLSALRRLAETGWVQRGARGWRPATDLRRSAVLAGLSPPEAQRMHLTLAEKWDRLSPSSIARESDLLGSSLQRARHFILGGRPETGFQIAGPELALLLRLQQAERVLRFFEDQEPHLTRVEAPYRQAMARLLAEAQLATGRFPEAGRTYATLLHEAAAPDERIDLTLGLARSLRFGGDLAGATERVADLRHRLQNHARLPEVDALLADILLEQARYAEATNMCALYLSGERACTMDQTMSFRHVRAKCHFYRGEIDAALALFRENCTDSERSGHLARRALALNSLGSAYVASGDIRQAAPLFQSCAALCQEIGDLRGLALADVNLGVCSHRQGDIETSAKSYGRALVLFRRIADRAYEARTLYNMGALRTLLGDLQGAENALSESIGLAQNLGMPQLEALARLGRSENFQRLGDHHRALSEAQKAAGLFDRLDLAPDRMRTRLKAIELLLDLHRDEEARLELKTANDEVARHPSTRAEALLAYLTARAVLPQQPQAAELLLTEALGRADHLSPSDPELRQKIVSQMAVARSHPRTEPVPSPPTLPGIAPLPGGGSTAGHFPRRDEQKTSGAEGTSLLGEGHAPPPHAVRRRSVGHEPRDRTTSDTLHLLVALRALLAPQRPPATALTEFLEALKRFFGAERAILALCEGPRVSSPWTGERQSPATPEPGRSFFDAALQEALRDRKPAIARVSPRRPADVRARGLAAAVCLPVISDNTVRAIVCISRASRDTPLRPFEDNVLTVLSDLASSLLNPILDRL